MTTDPRFIPEYNFRFRDGLIGAQMLFVAFGALVLVPLLTGLDPNVALFAAGCATLIFQTITRGKVPIFLASSFAFIAPIIYGVQTWGIPGTLCGLTAAGLVYMALSALIRVQGPGVVERVLPPIVTGPVIMVIGLILSPVAVFMAIGKTGDGAVQLIPKDKAMIVAMVSLASTVIASLLGRGFVKLIPIFCGIVAGYATSLFFGIVDFTPVLKAPWFAVPNFVTPEWNLDAILFIVPVAIAPAIEHVGGILAIGSVTGKNYLEDPGIDRTLFADSIATMVATSVGGPPCTTYAEVTGAIALTRAFNPAILTWAAITAVCLAFVGKLGALLTTIPSPVMGGIMVLLFGAITVVGMNSLVRAGQDLMVPRNMAVVAIILVFGLGGMAFNVGEFSLQGIGLAGITGVLLNLVLPGRRAASGR
ncbi:uracil-xanthine permease family protein [Nitratidesulfovibrio vulgaris]|uniref:Uracil-xanthine permease n=1 Tax=Nitratidesulfovibrio vulgaris (strain DP4) TaxID=391774 RepID=A0A0H3A9U1_NITV4|nr:uracil-xanthine permease family protein [Nitratidesulfovibrio vulgaris]ABM28983.1 uracil-xanthine permease [Nitratidesulfovibrio vulgaris DP4]WCB47663.1 uracil-xanthine permease family protein [Nitratidesulfovibrio vulgaris]GEB81447.1 uracil permease [Desulfovibrio desulfuricans]